MTAKTEVAQAVIDALTDRINGWQAERQRIEIERVKRDRKMQRYSVLGNLIEQAQAEILEQQQKLSVPEAPAAVENGNAK
jgi:hypothetical protein